MAVDVTSGAPPLRHLGALSTRLQEAFLGERVAALRLLMWARFAVVLGIIGLLVVLNPSPVILFWHALLIVFAFLAWAHHAVVRRYPHRRWPSYLFATIDYALLAVAIFSPNPLQPVDYPPQLALRFDNVTYFFLLAANYAFTFQPRLMLWVGFSAILAWSAGLLWLISRPDAVSVFTLARDGHDLARLSWSVDFDWAISVFLNPNYVDIGMWLQNVVVMLMTTGCLSVVVWRGRQLVLRQAAIERERANLARYFPRSLVDRLAREDTPLGAPREQAVAVLFADIVGFTRQMEHQRSDALIAILREVHAELESAVFEHGGTLDKYLGDGVMTTFGSPESAPDDAARAIACGKAMIAAVDALSARRTADGNAPLRLSVGVHFGPVVLGDIGTERRLEYAVLGDTVNVAARLEAQTRPLGYRMIVSADAADAAIAAGAPATLCGDFVRHDNCELPGREAPIAILGWRGPGSAVHQGSSSVSQ